MNLTSKVSILSQVYSHSFGQDAAPELRNWSKWVYRDSRVVAEVDDEPFASNCRPDAVAA